MTKKETAKLIEVLADNYHAIYDKYTDEKIARIINTWHEVLENEKYSEVRSALLKFLANDNKGYPPAIGQILQYRQKETPVAKAPKDWQGL